MDTGQWVRHLPTGDIVLQERQYYTCEAACLGTSADTAYAYVNYSVGANTGLSGQTATIGIGTGTMVDNESSSPWLTRNQHCRNDADVDFAERRHRTFTTVDALPSSYAFNCSGWQTSSTMIRKAMQHVGRLRGSSHLDLR